MRKLPQVLAAAALISVPFVSGQAFAQAAAPAPEHTFTGKVALFSEYEFRGITQTEEKPAVQLSLDYGHSSGFYLGTFLTNIKWLKIAAEVGGFSSSSKVEWDIYGGYKFEVAKDWLMDVGVLRYEYPSSSTFNPKPNTTEIYAGLSYGMFNVKYSYSIDDTFGVADSKGSDFIEANVSWPVTEKLAITGHLGHQKYKNNKSLDYTVYKVGAVYDFGGGLTAGGYVKGTDADSDLYTYKGKDWGKDRLVGFVAYSF